MMDTLKGLIEAINTLGIAWSNTGWREGDDPCVPYITLQAGTGVSSGADDMTWCAAMPYRVELYTHHRDYALERDVEKALDDAGIYWEKSQFDLESQDVSETVYSVTVRED